MVKIHHIYVTHPVYLYGYDMIVSYARNHNSFMKFIMCGECIITKSKLLEIIL